MGPRKSLRLGLMMLHDYTRSLGQARIGDDYGCPKRYLVSHWIGIGVIIGARNPAFPFDLLFETSECAPSSVGPPRFPLCVVWRSRVSYRSPTGLLPDSYRNGTGGYRLQGGGLLIHIAASAGKIGVVGGGGMMQSSVWDSLDRSLGFGSLVRGARQANRSIRVPSPPKRSTQASCQLDHSLPPMNGRAKQFPYDACLSRSCRLLAAKPPNGTRRRFLKIPGPVIALHAPTRCLLRMQTSEKSSQLHPLGIRHEY